MDEKQKYINGYGILNKGTDKEMKVVSNVSDRTIKGNKIIISGKLSLPRYLETQ